MIIVYLLHSGIVAGGVRIVCEHCNRLADKGHEVYISLITNLHKLDWFNFTSDNIKIINFSNSKEVFEKADCIVSTFWSTAYDNVKINTKADKYYLIQQKESNFYSNKNEKQLVDKTYDLPLKMITISPWLQDFLKKDHNKDSFLVRNGLDFDMFYPDDPLTPKKRFTVMIEGSPTNYWKNNSIIYEVLKGMDIDIISMSIENETRSNKHYLNPKQDDIRKIYSSCDAIIKVSLSEGLSGVIPEVFATGVCVIASDIPGINDYVIHEYNGLLIPPNNKQAIKESVIRLMNDEELANRLKINGMKTVHEKFNWDPKIAQLENIFNGNGNTKSEW